MKRIAIAIAITTTLLFGASLAAPAFAGTKAKDNPSEVYPNVAAYHDAFYDQTVRPLGQWFPIDVASQTQPDKTCHMLAKWGNLPNPGGYSQGFTQLKNVGGNACFWGGVAEKYLANGNLFSLDRHQIFLKFSSKYFIFFRIRKENFNWIFHCVIYKLLNGY